MIQSRDWEAVRTADGRARVTGVCVFPTSGWGAELRKHDRPPEAELLLELHVERPTGPVLQVVSAVPVVYEEATASGCERVSILPDGPRGLPVDDEPARSSGPRPA
jgi:hypothetical protein